MRKLVLIALLPLVAVAQTLNITLDGQPIVPVTLNIDVAQSTSVILDGDLVDVESVDIALVSTPIDPNDPPASELFICPIEPTETRVNRLDMWVCDVNAQDKPFYTPWGYNSLMGYKVGKDPGPLPLEVTMHRKNNFPSTISSLSQYGTAKGTIVIRVQEDGVGPGSPNSHWIQSGPAGSVANYNGRKMAAAIDYVAERADIDFEAGITLSGNSLGSRGAMHQPMIFPDPYRDLLVLSESSIGHMMIPLTEPGFMPDFPQSEIDAIDIRLNWDKVTGVHFAWRGGTNDSLGKYSPEFWDVCELRKLSCSGHWHQGGHKSTESGYDFGDFPFRDPAQGVDLRKPLPVITNNSSNYHGATHGWHNMGVSWDLAGITDTPDGVTVPLSYVAYPSPGPDLPDMDQSVTFDVTLRRVNNFNTCGPVNWTFGAQSGVVESPDCLLTVEGLSLTSGQGEFLVLSR